MKKGIRPTIEGPDEIRSSDGWGDPGAENSLGG